MVLAGVMLKLGIYGLGAYSAWCLVPPQIGRIILGISLLGAIAAGLAMFHQVDIKGLAAYSSIVHMAVALGAMSLQTPTALKAALFIAVGHGFSRRAVFLLVKGVRHMGGSRNPMLISGVRLWGRVQFFLLFCVFFAANGTPPFYSFWGEVFGFLAVAAGVEAEGDVLLVIGGVLCPAAYFVLYFRSVAGATSTYLGHPPQVKFQLFLLAHVFYLALFWGVPCLVAL